MIKANAANEALASTIYGLFYEDALSSAGSYKAGKDKKKDIDLGTPPVELSDEKSPLAKLLNKCYKLLQSHYQAIDYKALQPYRLLPTPSSAVPDFGNDVNEESKDVGKVGETEETAQGEEEEDHFALFCDLDGEFEPAEEITASPSSGSAASSRPRKRRGLDTHRELWNLFASALAGEPKQRLKQYKSDKTFDQYDGIQACLVPSSSRRSTSNIAGTKRCSGEAELDSDSSDPNLSPHPHGVRTPPKPKRAKTAMAPPAVAPPAPRRVTRSMAAPPAPPRVTRSMTARACGRGQRMECVLVPTRPTRTPARNNRRSRH